MSSAGTARKFDLRGLLHNLFGNNDEIEEEMESFENIDTKTVDVTAKDLEELKKSTGRLNVLAKRYDGIEHKNLKAKSKTSRAKTAVIKKQDLNKVKENQKQNEMEQKEMDRER